MRALLRVTSGLSPFLFLPLMALMGFLVTVGPDVWRALVIPVQEFCRLHLGQLSPADIMIGLLTSILLASAAAGGVTAIRELYQLALLSRSLNKTVSATTVSAGGCHAQLIKDAQEFAFSHGLLRPRTYISSSLLPLLSDVEMSAVLLHEAEHVRRRDPLRILLARILAAALFTLPFTRPLLAWYLLQLEVRADEQVVKRLGLQPLASALLKLLQLPHAHVETGSVAPFSMTEERIKRLVSPAGQLKPTPSRFSSLLAGTGTLVTSVALVTGLLTYGVSAFLLSASFCQTPMA